MEDWQSMAQDNYVAAGVLLRAGRWRSAVSRAYYAAYARAVAALKRRNVAMPRTREGPSHKRLPFLVAQHLMELSASIRWRLFSRISRLYTMRLNADYYASVPVVGRDARSAMGMLKDVFQWTREVA